MGLPVVGDGCCRMEIGEDGFPHGVLMSRVAARVKPGSDEIPVPPMTAMWTGAAGQVSTRLGNWARANTHRHTCLVRQPFCDRESRCFSSRSWLCYEV